MSQTGVGPVDDAKYPPDYPHLRLLKFVLIIENATGITMLTNIGYQSNVV